MRTVDSLEDFDAWVAEGAEECVAVEALDLRRRTPVLLHLRVPDSLFLGCNMALEAAGSLVGCGAIVIPQIRGRAFSVHRADLYGADELYAGFDPGRPESYTATPDHRIYQQWLDEGREDPSSMAVSLARRLHDHSITAALADRVRGRRVVAVMGGHGMERTDPRYRQVAWVAKQLTERGFLITSGGGPGAMEAAHLGAWLAGRRDEVLEDVLGGAFVRRPPGAQKGREYADPDWLARAWRVREGWPADPKWTSIGVPTWQYGHEPPTPFASHIAKYFANSVREDGVLAIATHGVVFAPGSAGTTQEIFQDACQNHYGTVGIASPMVLLGVEHWTVQRPVWSLLKQVSQERLYGELVFMTDDPEDVVRTIAGFEPIYYRMSTDPDEALETSLRRWIGLRGNWSFPRLELESDARYWSEDAVLAERVALAVGKWPGPVERLAPGPAAVVLADWLERIGGDDWIDRERARRGWLRALTENRVAVAWLPELDASGVVEPLTARGLLVLLWPDRVTVWAARLAD